MTLLQMVNKLLRRLREDTVTATNSSSYSQLLVALINEGMEEVQSRYMWTSLDATTEFDTVASQFEYDLSALVSGGGAVDNASNVTTGRSLLRMVDDKAFVYLYESGATEGESLQLISNMKMEDMYRKDTDHSARPLYFSLYKNSDGDGWSMRLYPLPDAVYTITAKFWTPQDEFANDATDDAVSFNIPEQPVMAYALMMAANERGEEMGEPGNLLERRYLSAISTAVEEEIGYDGAGNVHEFRRD